jgi:CHAT domain-containing protein
MPAETVLVTLYYAGVGEPPREGFHSLVCATDQPGYYLQVYDPSRPSIPWTQIITRPAEVGAAQTRIKYATAGIHTAYARRVLAEDPLFQPLSREARKGLSAAAVHFGPLLDLLARFQAAGKKHLVVWPHGPQYLLPFHLLPTGSGRVLADDWTVTITPTLQCLIGASRAQVRSPVLAVASAQGGVPYGLPAEPSVTAQAETVAAAFGATPILGATRESFCTMVQGARYIHIAAHGAQYLPAPTFNCVYLDDGPLYAHEILKLDLRSADLVTLSACQSALIRYDINDNLHGLPAAFLRSGAACVVGTLWPVAPAAAQDFFSALYGRIAAGDGKLAAFRTAQRAARDRHPQHRDWGAFSMLGDWQERPAHGG